MKKVLVLLFCVLFSGAAFADLGAGAHLRKWHADYSNLNGFGGNAFCPSRSKYLELYDEPCIGDAAGDNCNKDPVTLMNTRHTNKKLQNDPYNDEWGMLAMAAVRANNGGAYFCPTMIVGRNSNGSGSIWTESKISSSGCVWLCRQGFTGKNCELSRDNVQMCDLTPVEKANYDAVTKISGSNREDDIPMFASLMHNCGDHCGGSGQNEHNMIFVIVGWLDSGHGAWLRPYTVWVWGDGCSNLDTGVYLAPAHDTKVLGCVNGFEPNPENTECVPIKRSLCPTEVPFCAGWSRDKFDETKHRRLLVGDENNGSVCYQWRCKSSSSALTQAGGAECKWCIGSTRWGLDVDNGTCIECPVGKVFNELLKDSGYCEDAVEISTDVLLYGAGNRNTTITSQCWTKYDADSYKKCVSKGIKP